MLRTRRVFVAVALTAASVAATVSGSAAAAPRPGGSPQFGPGRTVVTYAHGDARAHGNAPAATADATSTSTSTSASPAPSGSTTADAAAGPPTAQFIVTYHGFPAGAQAAFQAAVDVWAHLISSTVPIRVDASWADLHNPQILGQASPVETVRNFGGAAFANTWYPIALANARAGTDLDPQNVDIDAAFNSTFGSWYLGTDGNPSASQWDLETIVLHELGHGLGFIGSMNVCNGIGTIGNPTSGCNTDGFPFIYDRFTENGAGTALTSFGNGAALAAQLQSGALFFDGVNADSANGGTRPALYSPTSWQAGSSYSHLDENAYPASSPNSLMTPLFMSDEVHHAPGPLVLAMFADMGWTDSSGTTATPYLAPLQFGNVPSPGGADSAVVLTNLGAQTLTITGGLQPAAPFSALLPSNGTTLAGGQSVGIPVHFDTTTPGFYNGSITITTDSGNVSTAISGAARSHTDTEAFVYAAYVDFLGTPPDPSGLGYWSYQIDHGMSRVTFLNVLSTSDAWVHAIVTEFYEKTLGRGPDPSGLNYWTGVIQNHQLTVAQVAAAFYSSNEYYNGFGGGTDAGWVNDLYVKILHRQADTAGRNYWVSVTQQQGRFAVAYSFYQSSESAHDRVAELYNKLLGRAPDAAGWNYWSQVVVSNGDLALATNLAASAEYAQRAVSRFP